MANKPNSYPKVPGKAWAALRKRAVAAPTIKITGDAVAALLEMSNEKSAMDNIVYPLRRLGLIDDDGALTERGGKWRTDAGYGDACDEILADVYPEALSQLTGDNGAPNPPAVRTWFDQQGFGASNAKQMARTYLMIASKEIPAQPTPSGDGPKKSPANKAAATKAPDKRTETGSGVAAGKERLVRPRLLSHLRSRACISTFKFISHQMPAPSNSTRSLKAWQDTCTSGEPHRTRWSRQASQ